MRKAMFLIGALFLFLTNNVHAQQVSGVTLEGVVTNASNSPVVSASISLVSVPVGEGNQVYTYTATTDANGHFQMSGIIWGVDAPGGAGDISYRLFVSAVGYSNYTSPYFTMDPLEPQSLTQNVQLTPVVVVNLINNCQDLQNINNNLSGNYQLANDIDCSATINWNNGAGFLPMSFNGNSSTAWFSGTLDGAGHTISNLYENMTLYPSYASNPFVNQAGLGLFEDISYGTVENLNIQNATIIGGTSNAGGILSGGLAYANINNVHVQGTINVGQAAGGISSEIYYGSSIILSSANAAITSGGVAGGLVGIISNSNYNQSYIVQSFAKGSINSTYGQGDGGLVGSCGGSVQGQACMNISNSYSAVAINRNCAGSIDQDFVAGGLIGFASQYISNITNSYAVGPISYSNCQAPFTGGLVGDGGSVEGGIINVTNSYWDTQATGQTSGIGDMGDAPISGGLTTAQMYLQSSYMNWDFNNAWITDNQHYPILIVQEQSQIDLWNVFSASSQENTFEPASPINTNWSGVDSANFIGVNWADLLVISKPPVWSYPSASMAGGFVNSINWTDITSLSSNGINWSQINVLSKSAINWASVNPLVKSGINWADWVIATTSNINWNDVTVMSRKSINWPSIGALGGGVNWTSLSDITRRGINWSLVNDYSHENTNWCDLATLSALKLDPNSLHTLRTIVTDNSGVPASLAPQNAQLTVNLTGAATGYITSSPSGITCTSGSGIGCAATYPLNQSVTLNFYSVNGSIVTNWGGCTVTSANTCTVTLNQNLVVNIAVNLPSFTIATSAGTGGTITPSGNVEVVQGNSQSFTITADKNYKINTVLVDNKAAKLLKGNIYTFTNVTAAHTISASFTATAYVITATAGKGGTISPSGDSTVRPGDIQGFLIKANKGYKINEVLVDNKPVKLLLGAIYIFTDVRAGHTISASFTLS